MRGSVQQHPGYSNGMERRSVDDFPFVKFVK